MEKTSRREEFQNISNLPRNERENALNKLLSSDGKNSSLETTGSLIKKETVKSVKSLGRGISHISRGLVELTTGVVKGVDATALALGAVAIKTIGLAISPIPAAFSNENVFEINKKINTLVKDQKWARLFGYSLLALGGSYGISQIQKTLIK